MSSRKQGERRREEDRTTDTDLATREHKVLLSSPSIANRFNAAGKPLL